MLIIYRCVLYIIFSKHDHYVTNGRFKKKLRLGEKVLQKDMVNSGQISENH